MRLPLTLVVALLAHQSFAVARTPVQRSYSTHEYYVLEHNPNAGASLEECIKTLGVELVEQAGELLNHWLVRAEKSNSGLVRREDHDPVLETLHSLQAISSQDSQFSSRAVEAHRARHVASSITYLERQTLRKRVKRDDSFIQRAPPPIISAANAADSNSSSRAVALRNGIIDPLFNKQWHIINDEFPQHMMNVAPVWEMGITGKGVISALVDDGLDYRSDDLAANFDASGSYDFNDHTDLPTPVLFDDHHGTRCGGQIAAVKNTVCGVGLAYESKVAGLRILSGPISDIDEAASLNYGFQNTSIYSCSWGPPDDGRSMEGPARLIQKAVLNGVENGRQGKGSIFVFASGNGAAHGDQCNFDGYTNSIYSVTVAAVDYKGLHPYYSEACAANMVVAYSSGSGQHIVTTDLGHNQCSESHGGTSAAAPNAVGVFALALQARPDLTWRDVQHLCVRTAKSINPEDPDWESVAEGRRFSYKYGFGVLDATAYVKAAQDWTNVKPQAWFDIPAVQLNNGTMNALREMSGGEPIAPGGVKSTITVTKEMLEDNNFEKLEHINIKVWISHGKRGDVEVELVSPHGIKSVLGARRRSDTATTGYPGWTFMSVKHWDEDPVGDWTIRVSDQGSKTQTGHFLGWSLKFWGSTIDPSKAKPYDLPLAQKVFPPTSASDTTPSSGKASTTKTHTKPTAHLPGDHGTAEGEKDKPAFHGGQDNAAEPSMTPTPDEGWFSDMSTLVSNQRWLFVAGGAVVLFGVAAGIFFWRRRTARRRANYEALGATDGLAMRSIPGEGRSGAPRTKELYDAFGEVSDDDDEDADEETGLRGGRPQDRSPGGLGFHSGFLDDDDPSTAGPTPRYKDEPDEHEHSREIMPEHRAVEDGMNSPTVSGDGSWEHAN